MCFCRLKAVGVLYTYTKYLVHSNRHFRFIQGPKCMLTLLWVLHLFSYRFQLLFRFFLFLALDVWDFETKSLFYCRVLKWLWERVLAHTPLTNAWPFFLWTSTFFFSVNATRVPFWQPLGYSLFIDTCSSFVSPWIQMSSSCKIMFFWWCEKQTNHARTSPPLFYIFHFFSCGVDLLVTVSLVLSLSLSFFFAFLLYKKLCSLCPLNRLCFAWNCAWLTF